ncbi:MAG: hypothetical protein J1E60_08200 [Christensenellaceae bacterium]|nr:hypothetical protein [Christensenellaceae bacterium]
MGLKKCPKCELNYIRDDQKLCEVCGRKHKISDDEEQEVLMCIECGEHPAMKGKELCTYCFKESLRQEQLIKQRKAASAIEIDDAETDDVGIDDIEVPLDDEGIPEDEINDMDDGFEDNDEELIDENDDEFDSEFEDE